MNLLVALKMTVIKKMVQCHDLRYKQVGYLINNLLQKRNSLVVSKYIVSNVCLTSQLNANKSVLLF